MPTALHMPLFEVYAMFIEAVARGCRPASTPRPERLADEALAAGVRSHGVNAEIAYAGILVPAGARPRAAGVDRSPRASAWSPPTRACGCGRSPWCARWSTPDRLDEAGSMLGELVGPTGGPARQPDVLPVVVRARRRRVYARRPGRSEILFRALAPYHGRLAIAGLAGISMGPVSGYAGRAAHAAGHLDEAEELLREAIATCVDLGLRPNEALARAALGSVLRELDRPGDCAEADAEEATARAIADAIGLVLPTRRRVIEPSGTRRRSSGMASPDPSASQMPGTVARLVAAAAVLVSGLVHLQLYFDGYRNTDDANFGRSFLLNGIASAVLAVALVFRREVIVRLAAAGLLAGTFVAFVASRSDSEFFGFRESGMNPSPQAAVALAAEIVGLVALAATFVRDRCRKVNSVRRRRSPLPSPSSSSPSAGRRCGRGVTPPRPPPRACRHRDHLRLQVHRGHDRVPAGTTVEWVNEDGVAHSLVAEDGSFQSPDVDAGGTFSFTFTEPGTYAYICSIHPSMHGTIVVT